MPVFDEFMTKVQREESVIYLSYPNFEKLLKTMMARLMKCKVYTEKNQRHSKKEINVEDVNLWLNFFNMYDFGLRPLLHPYVYAIGLGPRPSYILSLDIDSMYDG